MCNFFFFPLKLLTSLILFPLFGQSISGGPSNNPPLNSSVSQTSNLNIAATVCCNASYGGRVARHKNYVYKIVAPNGMTGPSLELYDVAIPSSTYLIRQYNNVTDLGLNALEEAPADIAVDDEGYLYLFNATATSSKTFQIYQTSGTNLNYIGGSSLSGLIPNPSYEPTVMVLSQNFAYLGFETQGGPAFSTGSLAVVNITDRSSPTVASAGMNLPAQVNSLYLDGDILRMGFENGLPNSQRNLGVRDNKNPVILNANSGNIPSELRGGECQNNICFYGSWFTAVYAIDETDPANPLLIGTLVMPCAVNPVHRIGNILAVGMDDCGAGDTLALVDISNPYSMTRINGNWHKSAVKGFASNGDMLYVSNWSATDGFQVIQLNSIQSAAAVIGNARITNLQVTHDAHVDGTLTVGAGLNVGYQGMRSEGPLSLPSLFIFGGIQFGTPGAYGRTQIWDYQPNSVLRLGADIADGDFENQDSSGIVVYQPSTSQMSRIRGDRFGLTSSANSALYYWRVDNIADFYTLANSTASNVYYANAVTGDFSLGAGNFIPTQKTLVQIMASTPTFVGAQIGCSNCVSENVCVGTAAVTSSQWAGMSGRNDACK